MRIGLFTDTYLPAMNGIVHVVESARRNLEALGHEVYIVAPKSGLKQPEIENNVLWVPATGDIFVEDQFTSVFFPPLLQRKIAKLELETIIFFTPSQLGILASYCAKKQNIPLIAQHCTDIPEYVQQYPAAFAAAVALSLTMPFMLKVTGEDLRKTARELLREKEPNTTKRKHFVSKLMAMLYRQCSAVIAVSPKIAKQINSWDKKINMVTIPTGVDPLAVDPKASKAFRQQFHIAEDDRVIMYAGRLAGEKNLDLLIEAFDRIGKKDPKATLVFVGDFNYREKLEAHAESSNYPERIIFAGKWPRAELGSIYAVADIFLFPSVTDTQALVVNEAALVGLPVVWIDDGLNDVLINKKTGLKAKNNAKDFAKKTLTLLGDPKLAREYGQAAKKAALPLGELKQTEKLVELLTSL